MIRFVDVSAGYGTEQEPVFAHFSETIEDGEFVLVAGGRSRDTDQMICSLFSLFGITELYKRYPNEMSGGQQQKVCLARAVMNYPRYLLADEPTGNLDPALKHDIVELLQAINDCGTTVIMVTHEHEIVQEFGGRIISMQDGRVVFDDVIKSNYDLEH